MTSASSAGRRARPSAAEAAAARSPEPHDGTGEAHRPAQPPSPAASRAAEPTDGPGHAPEPPTHPEDAPDPDVAALPLDTLLSEVGKGPLGRWLPGRSGARFAASLAGKPDAVGYRLAGLVGELGRIAAGTSDLEAPSKDRRFADPAWTGNPALHRVLQAYLAASAAMEGLVADAGLDWRDDQRMRFLTENLVEALAPSNNPFLNPAALKTALDTGGASMVRGVKAFVSDMAAPPRVPSMIQPGALKIGRDLAMTPGAVVFRSPVLELIQYTPQTDQVRSVPLLVVPPTINKFYVTDLAPGRSLVEHLVRSGLQVFMISWRNPDADARDWGMDVYANAILEALSATERIARTRQALLLGLCSGGILTSMLMGHLAAIGQQDRVAGLSLLVTVLDETRAGMPAALADRATTDRAVAKSMRMGYLDGSTLAEVFAWLRPGDLIWNYWVNNYLLGKQPPTFDILTWNADTTRMAARLHRDFIDVAMNNKLATPGQAYLLGTPVDLSKVHVDAYVVAGITDHLCPWQNCYRTTQLLGGATQFVLSTSGHIAAIVNPPGNAKAKYQVGDHNPVDPAKWLDGASSHKGSWWEHYTAWLIERGGLEKASPAELGGDGLRPLAEAPGTYLFED